MNTYFFYDGIRKLAKEVTGNENIYLGIRPYGFHAGNMLPHIVYPLILSNEVKKLGKEPRFKIFIFINDWEQDRLEGPDVKVYPFNVFPENTTFQYMLNPDDPDMSIVDYWEPIIFSNVNYIKKIYPGITIETVRNSQIKNHPLMKQHLLLTLGEPEILAKILKKRTHKKVLTDPLNFVIAVCPNCRKVKGKTSLIKSKNGNMRILHRCVNCGKQSQGNYEDFDYWFYHKPLAIPRLEIFDIDICITGADHYSEGDFEIRNDLIAAYKSGAKFPKTLYTSVILGQNGRVMGKSRGNTKVVSVGYLMNLVRKNANEPTIKI